MQKNETYKVEFPKDEGHGAIWGATPFPHPEIAYGPKMFFSDDVHGTDSVSWTSSACVSIPIEK